MPDFELELLPVYCLIGLATAAAFLAGAWIVCIPGGWIVARGLKRFTTQLGQAPGEGEPAPIERGFSGGGAMIGRLERLLIYLFVMAGEPSGIGFLIAAKSVFRFGELSDKANRLEAEYITIGTLMSFAVGLTLSIVVQIAMRFAPAVR
jgi:hypothetical protein